MSHPNQQPHICILKDETGSTGSTFAATAAYLARYRPPMAMLENVPPILAQIQTVEEAHVICTCPLYDHHTDMCNSHDQVT